LGAGFVTRIIRGATIPPRSHIGLELIIGPAMGEFTDEQLELAWHAYGEEIMAGPSSAGRRPWAYWEFELKEERPDGDEEAIRLAELGLLRDDEVAAIAERANEGRARIGTTAEHIGWNDYYPDRDAVELHEAVKRALDG
jgi:hypothetical protein